MSLVVHRCRGLGGRVLRLLRYFSAWAIALLKLLVRGVPQCCDFFVEVPWTSAWLSLLDVPLRSACRSGGDTQVDWRLGHTLVVEELVRCERTFVPGCLGPVFFCVRSVPDGSLAVLSP